MGGFSRIYKADLSDRQLMAFWELVQAAGRGRSIGFDRPAMDGPAFCRFLRRPGVHPWLVAWRGLPVALYYLTDLQGRSAHVHFCFLPCGTRRLAVPRKALPEALRPAGASPHVRLPLARAAALFGLGAALWEVPEQGFRLDTLIGITPQSNRSALAFVRSLGAREHASVPGLCWLYDARRNVPGIITTFDREAVPQRAAGI